MARPNGDGTGCHPGPDQIHCGGTLAGMHRTSEPGNFFAESEDQGLIVGVWGDEKGVVTLALLDDVCPAGSFFQLTPSLVHELAATLQACDDWLRCQESVSAAGLSASAGGGRGDDGAESDCGSVAAVADRPA